MIIPGERSGDGVRQVPVPRLMRQSPVMSAEQAAAIAALARSMSARLGYLADLEGGIAAGEIYLFQARPITTLTPQSTPADAAARGVPAGTPNRDLTFRPFPDSSGALH
jgi:phosphoenolpyruvate synthase/pyruvate phosphate dikinase